MDLATPRIAAAMRRLEALDAADRKDGTPQELRLRSVGPEVGRFLQTLVVAIGARTIVELGTSGGYSTLWLAEAARRTGGRIVTFEVDDRKIALAATTFADAGVDDLVELRHQDAAQGLVGYAWTADLVFLDVEKKLYLELLEPIVAALRPGGLLVADNLLSHAADLEAFRAAALAHPQLSGQVVPIGCGELVAVRFG